MPRRRRKRGKGGRPAVKTVSHDGINFRSGLEKYMYLALKKEKLFELYEGESFELMEASTIPNRVYERQANGKGEFKLRSSSIRSINYTPDFTGKDYIIECKGLPNESFPLRFKMFKKLLGDLNDERAVYKPQCQKECDMVVDIIKSLRNNK